MKEPKFRIWDKLNKVFFYIDFQNNYLRAENASMVSSKCYPHLVGLPYPITNKHCPNFSFLKSLESDNYTWQQFTGLKDIDGKDIYDGDLLEDEGGVDNVYYKDGCFWIDDIWLYELASDNKIIGNIFENPNLI